MKYVICFFVLWLFFIFGCAKEVNKEKKDIRIEEIVCKHPRGHIVVYKVDIDNATRPANFRGGLWYFKTVDGLVIRATNCHTEIKIN